MYWFDLGCLSSHEWRITHALSHHTYTNTVIDYELAMVEPFMDYRVYESKSFWYRSKLAFVFLMIISPVSLFVEVIKRVISIALGLQRIRPENLLPLLPFFVILMTINPSTSDSSGHWALAFKLWFTVQAASNFGFLSIVTLMSHHHHHDLFHVGDEKFRFGLDWGLAQLDATADRKDSVSLLVELSMFGSHVLHHLFPTLDHGLLDSLKPIADQTIKDFKLPRHFVQSPNTFSQKELFTGTLQQLARTKPRQEQQR